jgi:LysM repeat protein
MKILKILGIAAGLHAIALLLIFANPGCSYTHAAGADSPPISAAPGGDPSGAPGAPAASEPITIRYSPTRPGTAVASALETQPVSDVTPATTYTVAKGDSLSSISSKNQLTKADLAAANNLRMGAVLRVGQKLIIPAKGAALAAATPAGSAKAAEPAGMEKLSADSTKHVVKAGETLGGIARKYGVKQGDIAVANNITDPRKIHPGQELVIPTKSASAKAAKASRPRADTADTAKAAPAAAPAPEQDLDAGLKQSGPADVPVVKIEDPTAPAQPKNP